MLNQPARFLKPRAAETFDVRVRAGLAGNGPVDLAADFDFDRQLGGRQVAKSPRARLKRLLVVEIISQ